MVASRRCSVVASMTFLFLMPLHESLKCPDPNNADITTVGDRCFYIYHIQQSSQMKQTWADGECRNFDEVPHRWRLPKLDEIRKRTELDEEIRKATNLSQWSYWIGLQRDVPSKEEIWFREWDEESKWRWTLDNTTVSSWPSWAKLDNANGLVTELEKTERCLLAQRFSPNQTAWYDWRCDIEWIEPIEEMRDRFLLVCESASAKLTMTTTTSTSSRTSTKKTATSATSTTSTTLTSSTISKTSTTPSTTSITTTTSTILETLIASTTSTSSAIFESTSSAISEISTQSEPRSQATANTVIVSNSKKSKIDIPWQWFFLGSSIGALVSSLLFLLGVWYYIRYRRKKEMTSSEPRRDTRLSKFSTRSISPKPRSVIGQSQYNASYSSNKTFTTTTATAPGSSTDFASVSTKPSQVVTIFSSVKKM